MSVNALNVIAGAASVYFAPFGTTFPTDSTATVGSGPPSGFTDFGGTSGGVQLILKQTIKGKKVDQILMDVGGYPTAEEVSFKTKLAEATLANLNTAMNSKFVVTPQSTYTTADWSTTVSGEQLTYLSVICDGWGPTLPTGQPARRRLNAYKVLSEGNITGEYKVDGQLLLDVTFHLYFVSGTQAPFHIVDQTA